MINTSFTYDGISSDEMGVSLIRLNSGMIDKTYVSRKEILEQFPNNSLYPNFFGIKYQPLTFSLVFTCENDLMDSDKMYKIANWLCQNEYKPFISADNPSIQYYCMAINQASFMTNGLNQGYFELEFRCRDGFGWTVPTVDEYDFTGISSTPTIQLTNYSNVLDYVYPELEFELTGSNTGLSLINVNDAGREFKFTGLDVGDEVYIDNQKRIILSTLTDNVFSKFNKKFFRLKKGVNNIQLSGECILRIRKQFPVFMT